MLTRKTFANLNNNNNNNNNNKNRDVGSINGRVTTSSSTSNTKSGYWLKKAWIRASTFWLSYIYTYLPGTRYVRFYRTWSYMIVFRFLFLRHVLWRALALRILSTFHLRPDAVGPNEDVSVDLASVLQVNRYSPGGGVFVGKAEGSVQDQSSMTLVSNHPHLRPKKYGTMQLWLLPGYPIRTTIFRIIIYYHQLTSS